MVKSLLHLDESKLETRGPACFKYESCLLVSSRACPGVSFTVHRISFGRRMELCARVREIAQKLEFLEAGEHLRDKIDANLLSHEIDKIYLEWGLVSVGGLLIDGEPATAVLVIEKGPEELAKEIVDAIKGQCGLSEEERKN